MAVLQPGSVNCRLDKDNNQVKSCDVKEEKEIPADILLNVTVIVRVVRQKLICLLLRPSDERHLLAPAFHDSAVLLGSEGVARRLRQRLDLTGQIVAAGSKKDDDVILTSCQVPRYPALIGQ